MLTAHTAYQSLQDAQGNLQLDPRVQQVFLTGYLCRAGAIKVALDVFDAAADEFLAKSQLTGAQWLQFLCTLADQLLRGGAAAEAELRQYLFAAMAEYRAAQGQASPTLLTLPLLPADAQYAQTLLGQTRPVVEYSLGHTFCHWQTTHAGDEFAVALINCEGGPALVGFRRHGARVVESTRPVYNLTDALVFNAQAPEAERILLQFQFEGAGQVG
jgi:hypothetical protein